MGLLSPWFLLGAAAIALPIYIHLLRRHVTTPLPFSSLMFFERGTQSSTRHRRLRYLLLFSLRAALLLLLVLAFANPFVRVTAGAGPGALLLVVIDNSLSMQAGTRFADAKQGALRLLASRTPGQPAQIVALGSRSSFLTQQTQDSGVLRSAVENLRAGDSRANLGELARSVRVLKGSVKQPIDVHLFSDMQKTALPANFSDMALPENVTVTPHIVGAAAPNWTVESVHAPTQLNDPKDPKTSRVEAVIAGYGTPAASRTATLLVNGKITSSQRVQLDANGRATVAFHLGDVPYGLNRCGVRIDAADALPADDVSWFAIKRADPERVLFVHQAGDTRSGLYFGAALAAATKSAFTLQSVESNQSADLDPTRFSFVVLSDALALPTIFEHSLTQYVNKGGSILIATGSSSTRHASIPVFGGTASEGHTYGRANSIAVNQVDLTHPVISGNETNSTDDTHGDAGWRDVKVFYAAAVDAGPARVIARLSDGQPLLLEKRIGAGHALLLASGLDNVTSDLPVRPVFVSFIDHAARYLAASESGATTQVVDAVIPLHTTGQPAATAAGVEILDPEGHRALSLSEAAAAQSFQLTRAGFYQVRFADGKTTLFAVNPDQRESNLEPIAPGVLDLWAGGPAKSAAAATNVTHRSPQSIWWYVMLLVLLAAVAESVVASRYLGTQREEA